MEEPKYDVGSHWVDTSGAAITIIAVHRSPGRGAEHRRDDLIVYLRTRGSGMDFGGRVYSARRDHADSEFTPAPVESTEWEFGHIYQALPATPDRAHYTCLDVNAAPHGAEGPRRVLLAYVTINARIGYVYKTEADRVRFKDVGTV